MKSHGPRVHKCARVIIAMPSLHGSYRMDVWSMKCFVQVADRGSITHAADEGLTDPVGTVERLEAVPAADRELILGKTAAKLLRLE
jgi:hypothetical protein